MTDDPKVGPDSAQPEFDMSPDAVERRLYELCSVSRLAIELSNSAIVGRAEDLIERKKVDQALGGER